MKKLLLLLPFLGLFLCSCEKDDDEAHQQEFTIDGTKYHIEYAYQTYDLDGYCSVVFMEKEKENTKNNIVMIYFLGNKIPTGNNIDVSYMPPTGTGLFVYRNINWAQEYDPQNPQAILSKAMLCTEGKIEIKKTNSQYKFWGKNMKIQSIENSVLPFELIYEGLID